MSTAVIENKKKSSEKKDYRFIKSSDGTLYLVEPNIDNIIEPEDEGFVGGGIKLDNRRIVETKSGKSMSIREVITRASGGSANNKKLSTVYRLDHNNREEMLDAGYNLWKYDSLGGTIVNLTTFFTYGKGITIQAEGIKKKILNKFWKKNDMTIVSKDQCSEGVAYGENYWKLKVHKEDISVGKGVDRFIWKGGQVEFIPIDPKLITGVDHNPSNIKDVYGYIMEYEITDDEGNKEKEEEIIPPIDKYNPNKHESAMIHIKFNAATNDVHGLSDLVRIREWLLNYTDFLRDSVIINKLYRSPCYDITIKDADDLEIRRAIRRYEGWEIGSNPVHNDKEEWKILEFKGANISQESSRRALLLMVAAGVGFAEYMLADGANANMATTQSQQLPVVKKFEDRQMTYKTYWNKVFEFVLEMATLFGKYGIRVEKDFDGDPIWNVDAEFPPILVGKEKDIAESNSKALEDRYISERTACARMNQDYDKERIWRFEESVNRIIDEVKIENFRQSEDFKKIKEEGGSSEGEFKIDKTLPPEEIEKEKKE